MTAVLEVRDLAFNYEAGVSVLSGLNASFTPGEMVAITGPSGKGKSTLLYLLGLMLAPTSGQIFLDGVPASSRSDRVRAHLRAERFGFVFQDAALDATRTVLDNVLETVLYRGKPRSSAISEAEELLEHFGVQLRTRAKPGQVSGGQAQRIALCRALIGRPSILLADEPTGNLDPNSSEVVERALREHADSGAVVVVVTHDPFLASRCHRSIRL